MISSTLRKAGPYAGDGTTTVFPFAFKVFKTADVQVVRTDATGADTVLVSGYTVQLNSNQDTAPGGKVTLGGALPTGLQLTVASAVSALQPMQITNNGGFFPRVLNDMADRVTILIQQLAEKLGRAVVAPIGSNEPAGGLTLPAAPTRANKLLAFDALGRLYALAVSAIAPQIGLTDYGAWGGANLNQDYGVWG